MAESCSNCKHGPGEDCDEHYCYHNPGHISDSMWDPKEDDEE